MGSVSTAVLIHGIQLGAKDWENIVWGDPRNGTYGRISAGLREALRFDASLICFGSGASEKDGLKEAEYSLRYAIERLSEVPEFTSFGITDPKAWLTQRAFTDTVSLTTREEIENCAKEARARDMKSLVLVTNPTHIARALQTALVLTGSNENVAHFRGHLYAAASDVPYADSTADDVVIIEPPHYPGTTHVRIDYTLKGLRHFMRHIDLLAELNNALARVIDEYKRRLK